MADVVEFLGTELRNNIIFDPSRRLKGEIGNRILDHFDQEIAKFDSRRRALRPADAISRRTTLSAFLSNLAASAFNKANSNRFVSVAFGKAYYAKSGSYSELSYRAATVVRDFLSTNGWTEGRSGFNRYDYLEDRFGMLTRIRATPALIDLFAEFSFDWRSMYPPKRDPIKINKILQGVGPEPASVTSSRQILDRVNARIARAEIYPPSERGADRSLSQTVAPIQGGEPQWQFEGDLTATTLYRSFSFDWDRGGRLYGAWWLCEPADVRAGITIDGAAVCELDYRQLHPSLLYARLGSVPPNDIYTFGGLDRELNKETFMRLLNGKTLSLRNPATQPFPNDQSFPSYVERYVNSLEVIRSWLGISEGLKLQKEDSDLAISVLDNLDMQDVIALPVHDSFVVKIEDRDKLYNAMRESFISRYGILPEIREYSSPKDAPPGP